MNLEEIRKPWADKCNALIEKWTQAEMGLLTVERWQAERRDFYDAILQEMERCGNDFFFPPSLKRLIAIRGPADLKLIERMDKGWVYCRQMAQMNEVEKVLKALDLLDRLSQALRGPIGWTLLKLENGTFKVERPEVDK